MSPFMSPLRRLLLTALLILSPALAVAQTPAVKSTNAAKAIFAGGCFWCMEAPFDKLPGVISTTSGYIGGQVKNPTYEQVSSGRTGHTEAVQVEYDPSKVSYEKLLQVFWMNIDPTVRNAQFCDHGTQYRSGIFYLGDDQRKLAEASKTALLKSKPFKADIVTEITQASEFYPAEDYHQDYYQKNPVRYKIYRNGCGRDARLKELWGRAPE
jgi:peptide-methionine (S)-S-oxide reductase